MKKLLYTALPILLFNVTIINAQLISPTPYLTAKGIGLTKFHDSLVFYDFTTCKLWIDNGNFQRIMLKQFPTSYNAVQDYDANSIFYCFDVITSSATSNQVWITDGSVTGTTMVMSATNNSELGKYIINVMDTIYFSAPDSIYRINPNGTKKGIYYTGGSNYHVNGLYKYGNFLVIETGSNSSTYKCVVYDVNTRASHISYSGVLGVSNASEQSYLYHDTIYKALYSNMYLTEINPDYSYSVVDSNYQVWQIYGVVNNKLLFHANPISSSTDIELYAFDLNTRTVSLVKDINPGTSASTPFAKFGAYQTGITKVFFFANDGTNGQELWVTNGTTAGTHMISNLSTASTNSTNDTYPFYSAPSDNKGKTASSMIFGDTLHTNLEFTTTITKERYIYTDGNTLWQYNYNSNNSQESRYWQRLHNYVYFTIFLNSTVMIQRFSSADITTSVLTYGIDGINNNMALYPNPTTGNVSVNLIKEYKNIKIEITDVQGKRIYASEAKQTNLITLDFEAPKGLYFVSVTTEDNKTNFKVVKE